MLTSNSSIVRSLQSLVLALSLTLAACGGSGSGAATVPALANANDQNLSVGDDISIVFDNNGAGAISACAISGTPASLPAGLALSKTTDGNSCQITGALIAAIEQSTYTITATNAAGSDSATVSITTSFNLHVSSPDWRDQVIYFAMIDRFNDGNPANNDQDGYYDTSKESHYSGGDLQGLTERLDYIENLGATAVWITPPVANQWWNPAVNFSGYHGYWARDFKSVDEHYGTLDEYKALSSSLHNKDMYLIQDVVPNHMGDFFRYGGGYNPNDTAENFSLVANNVPVQAPTQSPFHLNDRTNPEHFAANIYHWTPHISDFSIQLQEYTYQLADLDDLNTENSIVIDALKDSFGYWIREVGVDGFRVDTVKFIDHPFWNKFFHDSDGIEAIARATGRDDFLHFGEVFESSRALTNTAEIKIASFEGTTEAPELKSLLGFPLYVEMGRVFADGRPTSHLRYRLEQHMSAYRDPFIVPNFVDNHDVARFLASASVASFKQALTTIFTIPGIPVLWQGDEQALLQTRQTMFAGGIGTSTDQFDTQSEMYLFVQRLAQIRTGDPLWTRGDLNILAANEVRSGVIAWRRSLNNEHVFVVMNTSDRKSLLNIADIGISTPNAVLSLLMGINHEGDVSLDSSAALIMELAPRAIVLLKASGQSAAATGSKPTISPNPIAGIDQPLETPPTLTGTVSPVDTGLVLVIDGDLGNAIDISADNAGAWSVDFPRTIFSVAESNHFYEVYASASNTATAKVSFATATVSFTGPGAITVDPQGDDNGPTGMYTYPQDETFSRQQDIEQISISHEGPALRLIFTMREFSDIWAPTNGFDHVSFHIFFDLPGSTGITVMPEQQSNTPSGFAWDLAQRTYGWANQIYGTKDATATERGESIAASPFISFDKTARTVTFLYDGFQLGVESWVGVKVYATTWDIDGIEDVLRPISPEGAQWVAGGAPVDSPKIMDSVGPLVIE